MGESKRKRARDPMGALGALSRSAEVFSDVVRESAAAGLRSDFTGVYMAEERGRRRLHVLVRETTDNLRAAGMPVSCAEECSACCSMHVDVTVFDILRLVAHVESLPEPERSRLRDAVAATAERIRGMTVAERWRAQVPCAFLDARGRCGVYAVRPSICMGYFTRQDPALCGPLNDTPHSVDLLSIPLRLMSLAWEAVEGVLRTSSLDLRWVELNGAVALCLADPSTIQRWLRGERVFDAVATKDGGA